MIISRHSLNELNEVIEYRKEQGFFPVGDIREKEEKLYTVYSQLMERNLTKQNEQS